MNKLIMLFIPMLMLTACASFEDNVAGFEAMDCAQLYQETNRYQDKLSSAEIDSVASLIIEVFGDKEESRDAEIDGVLADMDIETNKRYLMELERIKRQKNCS